MNNGALQWYALHVKSKHEFATNSELLRKGVETYLPAVKRLRQWKDRKKLVEFPLFPGYIFVHIRSDQEDFCRILKTRGVVTLLSSEPGFPTAVPTEEINSLRLIVGSGNELDIYPHLKKGTRVRVKRGLLAGAEGTLVEKEERFMLLINIELLGRSVGVKVYADDVEAV
ncbi:MAG: transcription termination factor NusG domain [Geobacteraceae bacterium]|nr:MAG: transcription termination factor NusG domain [Geobacteraceae bacterium]